MAKIVRCKTGASLTSTALVVAGWFVFIAGFLIENNLVKTLLLVVARVLPQALRT
jgi:hypothetical protein